MESKTLGITVVLVLVLALTLTIVYAGRANKATAAVTQSMSSEGFSSYEEMMKAHHPDQAAGGGCGGAAETPTGSPPEFAGQKSNYGITYDQAGYEQLLKTNSEVTSQQTKLFVGLDVQMPCCGVKELQAKDNCQCGHHVALYNLAKLLASKDYTREQIQSEIDKWKQVFFPAGGSGNTGGC